MKYTIVHGKIHAQAESEAESNALLALQVSKRAYVKKADKKRKTKYRTACYECGKKVKGLKLHLRMAHNITN